jgi:hypothetical protein
MPIQAQSLCLFAIKIMNWNHGLHKWHGYFGMLNWVVRVQCWGRGSGGDDGPVGRLLAISDLVVFASAVETVGWESAAMTWSRAS